jgi:general secretion pathway protein A
MYLSNYNLSSKPFEITTDPKYIWFGEKHAEALATLKYGIQEDKGFLVLTGEIGTGKTSLINCLLKELDFEVIKATIPDPDMPVIDFFNFLSEEFNMSMKFDAKGDFLIYFKQFLLDAYSDEKKVLLIIDEAQRLNFDLLEQIRLLSNIEVHDAKLINIFFVGQNEFNDILMDEKSKAVRQRIAVRCCIDPLTATETKEFIEHRLKVAGSNEEIFSSRAVDKLFSFSQGYPRLINILCDHALLTGYAAEKRIIDEKVIIECAEELKMPFAENHDFGTDRLMAGELKSSNAAVSQNTPAWTQPVLVFSLVAVLLSVGLTYFGFRSETIETPAHDTTLSAIKEGIEHSTIIQSDGDFTEKNDTKEHRVSRLEEKPLYELKNDYTQSMIFDENSIISGDNSQKHTPFSKNVIVIQFGLNSSKLPNKDIETLDQLANYMINRPETKIKIIGYTDSTGDYDYNLSVSKLRADKIKNYLCSNGVNSLRIETLGLGPDNPIASNATLEGRRKNRRVEIEFEDQFKKSIVNKKEGTLGDFLMN